MCMGFPIQGCSVHHSLVAFLHTFVFPLQLIRPTVEIFCRSDVLKPHYPPSRFAEWGVLSYEQKVVYLYHQHEGGRFL